MGWLIQKVRIRKEVGGNIEHYEIIGSPWKVVSRVRRQRRGDLEIVIFRLRPVLLGYKKSRKMKKLVL